MKHIRNLNDLCEYGITPLTGEACRYGMRILCDLTPEGASLVRQFLGMRDASGFERNWNSGAVASVMLGYDIFKQLAAFILLQKGCTAILSTNDGTYGWEATDSQEDWDTMLDLYRKWGSLVRTYRGINGPGQGDRMTHQMSGRTS